MPGDEVELNSSDVLVNGTSISEIFDFHKRGELVRTMRMSEKATYKVGDEEIFIFHDNYPHDRFNGWLRCVNKEIVVGKVVEVNENIPR